MKNKFSIILFLLCFLLLNNSTYTLAQDSKTVQNISNNKNAAQSLNENVQNTSNGQVQTTLQGKAVAVDLTTDKLEYFEDKNEFVATGGSEMVIKQNNAKLQADKIIYNQENQIVTAEGNVKLLKNGKLILGDYAKINMNTESALIDKPNTYVDEVKVNAKTANVYSNRIDAFKGQAVLNNEAFRITLSSGSNISGAGGPHIISKAPESLTPNLKSNSYKIISKELIVKSYPNKNVIAIKNANVMMGKISVAKIPYLEITSDKESGNVEDNLPEIGFKQQLGWYGGPSHVFFLPGGTTLKASPLLSYAESGGFGGGLFARITNSSNKSEFAYDTSKSMVLFQGTQKLFTPYTKLIYGGNEYVDNGMFGRQKPRYVAEIVDNRKLASAMNFSFYQRSSAGYAQDYFNNWGTSRFQLQGTLVNDRPLFAIKDYLQLGAISQYDISVYGNGSTFGLLRGGPTLGSKLGPLSMHATYFQAAAYGQSPFLFDRFVQGKSNLWLNSDLKLCKYVSVGYLASLNLLKDNWNHKLATENQLYTLVGPEDFKLRIGYDTIRKASIVGVDMLLGQGKTTVDFDKMKYYQYDQQ